MSHSVVGLDVGNDTSCVAMARKRGIDVLLNKESTRETPSVVNFGDKMRFLGTDGLAKMGLAPQNTVHQLKRLLGRKFSDPSVQTDIAKLPFQVSEAPDGGCLITVQFQNEQQTFTPEQAMAMVLVDLKKIAENESGVPPVDCVLSVPVFYDEPQRYAMLNAAHIAGLNCLRLMNETTATALAYGIFKTDLPETEPVHVAFVDVSVVSLKKTGLHMRSHAWDESIGGREFDEMLFDHFNAEFKAKHKIDIRTNKKAAFKLRVQCGKAKKILSANTEASIAVECIMNDVDVRGSITRDEFEAMLEPSLQRFRGVLQQALQRSGVPQSEISSVEVVGSSTRIPCLARIVEEVFGKAASRTMNAKECVSRGCALQCAMLSPAFKVRDFEVIDTCPSSIEFHWEKEGEPTSQ
ncbi:heat shock protein 70E, partial [Haematococcus lacustris]